MKSAFAIALGASLLFASAALAAEAVDVSELTCKQFNGYDDENKAIIMMWFEGYYTEEDEPAVIDFGKMASHLAQILIKCEDAPDAKVLDFTDDIMGDD